MKGWNYPENITQSVSLLDVTPKIPEAGKPTPKVAPSVVVEK